MIRRHLSRKILAAFLGTVGALLIVLGWVVGTETQRQIHRTEVRAAANAVATFRRLEALQQGHLQTLAGRLADRRTGAALEAAIETSDARALSDFLDYEVELAQLPRDSLLVVFADPWGTPVLALEGGEELPLDRIAPVAPPPLDELSPGGRGAVQGYRLIDGSLYPVVVVELGIGARLVGMVALGLRFDDSRAAQIGEVAGFELCLVVAERCVAGSPGVRGGGMAPDALVEAAAAARAANDETSVESIRRRIGDARYDLLVRELGRGSDGTEVRAALAIPLDAVLAPFDGIRRALMVGGALALVLATILSLLLARGLTGPVRSLVSATERVAAGDLDVRVDTAADDEVGALARAFNRMVEDLALKERYRGLLDKVVSREIADELLSQDVELGGEVRTVTVLFADIRGFTAATEGMSPQAVIALLNESMAALSAAVDRNLGVVDKFVGDEIMALFGAPVARDGDAERAVRCAIEMQEAMDGVNRARELRGDAPLGLGVGVATGEVVAGNMGSPDRLNYTVLGETVNLASRLCGRADAGATLICEPTAEVAGLREGTTASMTLKGFSRPVAVRELTHGVLRSLASLIALALALAAPATALRAQGLPTLEDAYLTNASGSLQAGLSGVLEIEGFLPRDSATGLIPTAEAFVAPRLRLFGEAFAGSWAHLLIEVRADRGDAPAAASGDVRIEQAFLRLAAGSSALQIGRFASPFGGYVSRHLAPNDALLRPPIPYDFRTMVCDAIIPASASDFLTWRDRPDEFRRKGVPPVWQVPYAWGAWGRTAVGPAEVHVAVLNSAPSSRPYAWKWNGGDGLRDPTLVAGVGLQLSAAWRLEGWWSKGPYLWREIEKGELPPDSRLTYYEQEISSLALSWAGGGTSVRGEVLLDRWEVPNVADDPREIGWWVEAQHDVGSGIFVVARVGGLDFLPLDDEAGNSVEWDYDVTRLQLGAGVRLAHNVGVQTELLLQDSEGPLDPNDGLVGVRLWWSF